MPVFRIEKEQGQWLTDMRLNGENWKAGDCIYHGRDRIEVLAVRESGERTTLVVKGASEQPNRGYVERAASARVSPGKPRSSSVARPTCVPPVRATGRTTRSRSRRCPRRPGTLAAVRYPRTTAS